MECKDKFCKVKPKSAKYGGFCSKHKHKFISSSTVTFSDVLSEIPRKPDLSALKVKTDSFDSREIMYALLGGVDVMLPDHAVFDGRSLEFYDGEGKFHRKDELGPAVLLDGGFKVGGSDVWYFHGRISRNPHDGPALSNYRRGEGEGEFSFYVDGVMFETQESAVRYWDSEDAIDYAYAIDRLDEHTMTWERTEEIEKLGILMGKPSEEAWADVEIFKQEYHDFYKKRGKILADILEVNSYFRDGEGDMFEHSYLDSSLRSLSDNIQGFELAHVDYLRDWFTENLNASSMTYDDVKFFRQDDIVEYFINKYNLKN